MAIFVGSSRKSDNWGEDFVLKKCIQYFDDLCIVYRNRELFGTQFDICILIPNQGIIIIEVKAWKPESILRVENGDVIILKTSDGETPQNPTKQARGYMFSMKNKIRQRTGKLTYVLPLVCFPLLSTNDYMQKGIQPVCEFETTLLSDDLNDAGSFFEKINLAMRNGYRSFTHLDPFTPEFMLQVRQVFESVIEINTPHRPIKEQEYLINEKSHARYSLLYYIPAEQEISEEQIQRLIRNYLLGLKIILIVCSANLLSRVLTALYVALQTHGLCCRGDNLALSLDESNSAPFDLENAKEAFRTYNFLAYLCDETTVASAMYYCIEDGVFPNRETRDFFEKLGAQTPFNFEQYQIEHADYSQNIIARAGAGTGKTYTMISRIGYLCHMQPGNVREMADRIVMITFTNDTANNMKQKIKEYFNNYYLLTGDVDYLRFISCIDTMQISTIHSYAKKLISLLGQKLGYGYDISIKSGEYGRKQIIAEELDSYLQEQSKAHGRDYTEKLGYPVYKIQQNLLSIINSLHNKSVLVSELEEADFGKLTSESTGNEQELHKLFACLVPRIEKKYNEDLKDVNSVHLSTLMSTLSKCLSQEANIERLKRMQIGTPQFMFVDEFQDTDDTQIAALLTLANCLNYKMFVVGDIKQCIYRFRGAEEKAFDRLPKSGTTQGIWCEYSLNKNFRTDARLLNLFDKSFSNWGNNEKQYGKLLEYSAEDRLIGTKHYNTSYPTDRFYRKLLASNESMRMDTLFQEINRLLTRINFEMDHGRKYTAKERTIAIHVRENWQAEMIRQAGQRRGITILTNTGGDLYKREPALDMLTLANALLHYDEPDYLYALVTSYLIGDGVSKSYLYQLRKEKKASNWRKSKKAVDATIAKELQTQIDRRLAGSKLQWDKLVQDLRVQPVMQVMRRIYAVLKPWYNYAEDHPDGQDYYRQNVDLLFEELLTSVNTDSLTINSLVDILQTNIATSKNVDSRLPEQHNNEITIECITVHKSKGLEYGAVILPFCSYPIDQLKRADLHLAVYKNGDKYCIGYKLKIAEKHTLENDFFDKHEEEEERMREEMRILYVAMTRAIYSFSWICIDNKNNRNWQSMIWEEHPNAI